MTHLTKADRFETLLALVCLAFSLCQRVGLLSHKQGHRIVVKNHGYKAYSFFRHGKNLIGESWRKSGIDLGKWANFLYERLLRQLLKLQSLPFFIG